MKHERTSARTLWIRLLTLIAASGFTSVCCADDGASQGEAQLKAAYVFNFVKFVDWEGHAWADVLAICFEGADDVREALALAVADKSVGTRKILVRAATGPVDKDRCNVVYVDSARVASARWSASSSALTIGDTEDFTRTGGIIRLYTDSNRLRFIVNVGNARRAGLQISSNLLKLATHVEQEATP
ncbi:MAG: YfiR family protein [Povalibacter sp.]